jgi:hypothetical protein
MIEHPRIESKHIPSIIKFIFNVCLKNEYYSRTANIILGLIFEKQLIQQKCTPEDSEKIAKNFEDYIKKALEEFMKGLKPKQKSKKSKGGKENKEYKVKNSLLETPYDILSEDLFNINERIHEKLIKCIKEYRKLRNENSNALLALLWFYPEHDDILLNLEEEFRPIYESAEVAMDKKKKEVIEQEKKDYGKQIQNYFEEVKNKRINKIENNKSKETIKKKHEEKIKKELKEKRQIERIMSGHEPLVNPNILNTDINLPKMENNYTENSNMLQAINAATAKYISKGALTTSNANIKNNYIKIKYNINEDKKKDDVFLKFGSIESVEKKKKKE